MSPLQCQKWRDGVGDSKAGGRGAWITEGALRQPCSMKAEWQRPPPPPPAKCEARILSSLMSIRIHSSRAVLSAASGNLARMCELIYVAKNKA